MKRKQSNGNPIDGWRMEERNDEPLRVLFIWPIFRSLSSLLKGERTLIRAPHISSNNQTLIQILDRVGTNMGYYGLTFSAANLSGDFYLNFFLSM